MKIDQHTYISRNILVLAFQVLVLCSLSAQRVVDMLRDADGLMASGNVSDAAELYERAGRLKSDRPEILYSAAEAYYKVRDYRKAALCYSTIKYNIKSFELAGLRYARCLKQDNRYYEAKEEFLNFAKQYEGERKAQMHLVIQNEIKGCDQALAYIENEKKGLFSEQVQILPRTICTQENEFAPIPFNDNLLYYSTIVGGKAKLFRTQRKDTEWDTPAEASGLPKSVAEKFGSGTFSYDGRRFYFTQCQESNSAQTGTKGIRNQCSIYVIRRTEDGWTEPERLRDYINVTGKTTTHPCVVQLADTEYLYFASDRNGGFGGLDIYVTMRQAESEFMDFSYPVNLGPRINTAGDEVTPYFDASSETLWYSTNGLPSLGGLDIFKCVLDEEGWTIPVNVGPPVNSPADDLYFMQTKSKYSSFFVSNRMFPDEKNNTRHDDIFEILNNQTSMLAGLVFDDINNEPVKGGMAALYELDLNGERQLVEVKPIPEGTFRFVLVQGKRFSLDIIKEGYETVTTVLNSEIENIVINLKKI